MFKKILYLLFTVVLLSACSLFQGDSFSGPWKMTWTSDSGSDEWDFVIEEDNSFETDYTFFIQGEPLAVDFEGNVGEDGALLGNIIVDGRSVGSLKGNCDYEKGEGTWRGGNFRGTWNIIKK